MRFTYTEAQLSFLRKHYPAKTIAELTHAFNKRFSLCKTEKQIIACTKNHKIRNGRKLNPLAKRPTLLDKKQKDHLVKYYRKLSRAELTEAMNAKFGLSLTINQVISFCKNHKITSGRTGFFKKGHVPVNKGTKGVMRGSSTSFKKGNIPKNVNPMGHERICSKDGYIWIKVEGTNPHTGYNGRYVQKHKYLYEQVHGPVPKGKVVTFIDGNKLNCDMSNLEVVDRGLLAQFNKNKLSSAPQELKPVLRSTIKLVAATAKIGRKIQECSQGG